MGKSRTAFALLVLPGGALLTGTLTRGGTRSLAGNLAPGGDPAAVITGLAATSAGVIAAWLTLCLALSVAAELPGSAGRAARTWRDRVTPVVVRRWAAIALGASVSATMAPSTAVADVRPVTAGPVAPSPGWTPPPLTPVTLPGPGFVPDLSAPASRVSASEPVPGWTPQRPRTKQHTDPGLVVGRQRSDQADPVVVVHRGDTLWTIAADHLGPDASDVEIARAWPHWYSANEDVIGNDPHLLLPGMRLSPPPVT